MKSAVDPRLAEMQKELGWTHGRLEGILHSAMDAIITVDEDQRIVLFNTAAENMFRCSAADMIGKSIERLIPQRFREHHAGHIRNFGETGTTNRAMGTLGAIWGVRADGEEFPIEASISQVRSGDKHLFTVILRDISERQRQEAHRLRLAAIVDSSEQAILSKDLSGHIISWNKGAEKLYGYTAEEAIGQPATMLIPPSLHEEEKRILSEVAAGRQSRIEETTRLHKNGSMIHIAVSVSPVKDARGVIVGAAAISHDIRDRLQMETALRESRQRMASILESAMDAIIAIDENMQVLLFNTAAEKMFRCPAAEVLGQSVERLIPARFRNQHAAHVRRFGETGSTNRAMGTLGAIWGVRADGEEFPIEASISQVDSGDNRLFTVILRDISERQRAEDLFRLAVESAPCGILMADEQGEIVLANTETEKLFGYKREELVGQPIETLIPHRFRKYHHEHRAVYRKSPSRRSMEQGRDLYALRKDGTEFPVEVGLNPVQTSRGNQVLIAVMDITARKQAEDRLTRQAEDLMSAQKALGEQTRILRLVMDSMGEGLVAADKNGVFLLWNQAAERILQSGPISIPPEQWSARYGAYLPDGVTLARVDQLPLVRAMAGEECLVDLVMRPPGSSKTTSIEVTGRPLRGEDGVSNGGVVVLRDTTERKQAEREKEEYTRELQRSNAELEQFAYVASHDLQEPLRMVASYTEILGERYRGKLDANADKYIAYAVDGAQRMQRLIRDLLAYARVSSQAKPLQPTDSAAVLKGVVRVMHAAIDSSKTEVIFGQLPTVMADELQLGQVFQNLISNAIKFHAGHAPRIEINATPNGFNWEFSVKDNGIGMDMEHSGRIFQMFQRLHGREEYEGTGIGLAIAKRIVERHGGRIWCESTPGQGSTFHFTIPKAAMAAAGGAL